MNDKVLIYMSGQPIGQTPLEIAEGMDIHHQMAGECCRQNTTAGYFWRTKGGRYDVTKKGKERLAEAARAAKPTESIKEATKKKAKLVEPVITGLDDLDKPVDLPPLAPKPKKRRPWRRKKKDD